MMVSITASQLSSGTFFIPKPTSRFSSLTVDGRASISQEPAVYSSMLL